MYAVPRIIIVIQVDIHPYAWVGKPTIDPASRVVLFKRRDKLTLFVPRAGRHLSTLRITSVKAFQRQTGDVLDLFQPTSPTLLVI